MTILQEDILSLPDDASTRFDLFEEIGQGTYGLVHRYLCSHPLLCDPLFLRKKNKGTNPAKTDTTSI